MSVTDRQSDPPAPEALEALLARWAPRQRWFATKGQGEMSMRVVGGLTLPSSQADVELADLMVLATPPAGGSAAATGTVYQVPVSLRARPEPALDAWLVGVLEEGSRPARYVYDGPHDPAFAPAWSRLTAGLTLEAEAGRPPASARGILFRDQAPEPDRSAAVLRGEQSNTSVIIDGRGPDPLMLKLFRVLAAGANPDVLVQTALADGGCERVAAPVGAVEGSWPDADGRLVSGHLSYTCEFLAGSQDAWREACRSVEAGEDFSAAARELGVATAQVHSTLAQVLPTAPVDAQTMANIAKGLADRVSWAVSAAPQLTGLAARAREVVADVADVVGAPPLQQVHGDYHLGQVLHSPTRGWVLLDFEGEPLRPLAERTAPDLALRDVAGMLRSFDYAARHTTLGRSEDDPAVLRAATWAQQCRAAFLDGYAFVTGRDPSQDATLLRALELDKALYEVVYEVRNRPDWVEVPMGAVHRLLPS